MKLTSELLTGVYEKSEELQRLEAVAAHNEVCEELQQLSVQIKGCMSLLDDLNIAYESLHTAGYSTEWYDIINKDNNFMAVVDLDMPKFFGGDEAKQAACEGAIIETIKKWAKAVWGWITAFFEKVKKALYWIKGLWVHSSSGKGATIQTFNKVCEMAAKSDNPQVRAAYAVCFKDLLMPDPDIVIKYLQGYKALVEVCRELSNDLNPNDPKNQAGTPDTPASQLYAAWNLRQKVLGKVIMDRWNNKNTPPRNKIPVDKQDGFAFVETGDVCEGVGFAALPGEDGCLIPKFATGYSQFDAPKTEYWYKRMHEACIEATKIGNEIANQISEIEKGKKGVERLKNQLLANLSTPDEAVKNAFEPPLRIYASICMIVNKASAKCIKLAAICDSEIRKAYTKMEELKRDLHPED